MAKSKQQKEATIDELTDLFTRSKSIVFSNFTGLKVSEANELRSLCRKQNVKYFVAKKTLLKIACEKANVKLDPKAFEGEISTVFGLDDEVTAAKVISDYAKTHQTIKIIGGFVENKAVSVADVTHLASLPSREVLISRVVGSIKAPLSGLVNVLQGNIRGLVMVLSRIKETK